MTRDLQLSRRSTDTSNRSPLTSPQPSPTVCGSDVGDNHAPDSHMGNTAPVQIQVPKDPLPGWPMVTKLITDVPDFEAFPSFRALNIKSLLYYQAELDDIQRRLHKLEYEDNILGERLGLEDAREWGKRADYIMACEYEDQAHRKQWELIQRMRKYAQINALPKADPDNVEGFRTWLKLDSKYCVSGAGAHSWGTLNKDPRNTKLHPKQFFSLLFTLFWPRKVPDDGLDLIVPRKGEKVDGLTRWVANEFVPFWQSLKNSLRWEKSPCQCLPHFFTRKGNISEKEKSKGHISRIFFSATSCFRRKPSGLTEQKSKKGAGSLSQGLNIYTQSKMLRFTSSVATVLACLLPTVAIAVLANLSSIKEILGVIAAFTAIFAVGLMWLTDGTTSRVEIFTATAA
ncbi:hypothetical protein CJF30_00009314 [Rutstroemia sp. NJR-2017a BBW]|nr:hypothetical protein CJF30_00009314 [Rutstroemia sp. NJR-2017a BBW]